MSILKKIAAAIVCSLMAGTVADAFGDRPMDKTLEVRILQTGFAGITGTIYRIQPNGDFVARTIINDEEGEVVKSGQFDLAAMMSIAQSLDEAHLEALPDRSEAFTGVNPAMIDLRYSDMVRVVTLPPGQLDAGKCAGDAESDLCRIMQLSARVREAVESYDARE